eukprot:5267916-Pleurochrysis_carterae.AAC.1
MREATRARTAGAAPRRASFSRAHAHTQFSRVALLTPFLPKVALPPLPLPPLPLPASPSRRARGR